MIFNIIEEVGSKSNRKRKFLSFPGLPQAHGASFFCARESRKHPSSKKEKEKKVKTAFSSKRIKEKWGPNTLSCLLAFFWGWTNLLPDSSISQPVHMNLQS
jgi:hypothetical protein